MMTLLLRLLVVLTGLEVIAIAQVVNGDAKQMAERFCSVSPNKQFALRIVHDKEFVGKEIRGRIQSMAVVTWPEKKFVVAILPEDEAGLIFGWHDLKWSSDSQWFVFHYTTPRFGYVLVFKREEDTFLRLNDTGDLSAPVKGQVRSQYVSPLRWIKPGVLLLEQETIFRGDGGEDSGIRFTASYAAKAKKFRIKRVK